MRNNLVNSVFMGYGKRLLMDNKVNNQLRLTEKEINYIKTIFIKHFGINNHIWVFGSRVDLNKRGGDLDLYIETNSDSMAEVFDQKIKFLVDLKDAIGDQKIDVIINLLPLNKQLLIYEEARTTGIMLL